MYSLVIPPEQVKKLFYIREKTGISIRKSIIDAINNHIKKCNKITQNGKKTETFI